MSAPEDWILVNNVPAKRVIVGRFGGPDKPEYTVAVGMRVFDPSGNSGNRRVHVVRGISEGTIALGDEHAARVGLFVLSHALFFRDFRPAPPEWRWLDPASVPVGTTEISACQLEGDEYTRCFYPSKPGHKVCPACKDKCSRNDTRGTPVLPPSVLTPVPRWRSLTGTKWSCGKPERVGEIYRVQNAFPAASGLNAWWAPFARKPKTPRVARVRALEGCRTYGHDCHPQWVSA